MKRLKNLDLPKIEKLFNEHFIFDKNDLNKGITCWTLTPRRENIIDKNEGLKNDNAKN